MRIGIDLGGTKIEAIALERDGQISQRLRRPTPADDYHAIVACITALVNELDPNSHAPVGVGMPGAISQVTGRVKNSNTQCLNDRPFTADLGASLGRRVRFENDANCMVLSETEGGAANGCDPVFGVIIGTGTGGGIYANGRVLTGANAIAGEWGHNPVPWSVPAQAARACYCGRINCVETFLCGAGLLRTCAEAGSSAVASVEALGAAVRQGETAALRILDDYVGQLCACLAVIVNIIDPAAIVLAGGLSNLPDLDARVMRRIPACVFSDALQTKVVQARYGDSSGVRGAARLWHVDACFDV